MTDEKTVGFAIVGAVTIVALTIFSIPLAAFINGWVLMNLWNWFILPVFEAAPTITVWQAFGLAVIVGFLTDRVIFHQMVKDPKRDHIMYVAVMTFASPITVYIFGWLVKSIFLI